MAATGGKPASVPLQPLPRPQTLVSDGTRLDGRGLEEFRSVCESSKSARRTARRAIARLQAGLPIAAGPVPVAAGRTVSRSAGELRLAIPPPAAPLIVVLDTKVISRAAGSAYAEFSNTKVMAAV
jgi:hypothetical protein